MLNPSEFLRQMAKKYFRFWNKVGSDHIEHGMFDRGHDFLHATIVAQYAILIAPDENTGRLAWFAGMLHNTDRMIGRENSTVSTLVRQCLDLIDLDEEGKMDVIDAVLHHHRLNDPIDSPVVMTLKDADRLGNLTPFHPARSVQHMTERLGGHVVVDPRFVAIKAETEYGKNPTAADDLQACLEWESMLRLPKAKEIGRPMFDFLRQMLEMERERLGETGILANADLLGPYFDEAYTHLKK